MLKNILFIDIETVSITSSYKELNPLLQELWDKKASFFRNESNSSVEYLYEERAGIYAEFGKVIVISIGYFALDKDKQLSLRVKGLASHNEKTLLQDFKQIIETKFDANQLVLCAHNGKEFDFPYLCRRMLINGISLPKVLDISGKKPWEIKHFDTLEMWKFGDRKNFTSLALLAAIFDIESSKNDIDGSMVNEVYYVQKDLDRIKVYCMHDVVVTAQLYLKLNTLLSIKKEKIIFLT